MKEIVDTVITAIQERSRPIFLGLYTASFIIVNHKVGLVLILSNKPVLDRYDVMTEVALSWPLAYGMPLLIVLALVYISPWLDYAITKSRETPIYKLKYSQLRAKSRLEDERKKLNQKRLDAAEVQEAAVVKELAAAEKEGELASHQDMSEAEIRQISMLIDPVLVLKSEIYSTMHANKEKISVDDYLRAIILATSFYNFVDRLTSTEKVSTDAIGYVNRKLGIHKDSDEVSENAMYEINTIREKMRLDLLPVEGYLDAMSE
ncbi:MAG: hypothetical protein AAGI37_20120 [Planctomycetota bacterium]